MASVAALGFSIISRYSGGGTAAARRDLLALRATTAALSDDLKKHTSVLDGIPKRWALIGKAALTIAPALIPIGSAAASATGALLAMSAGVGSALGAYGAAMTGAIKKTLEMAEAGKKLDPVQKEFVKSVSGMKKAWQDFVSQTQTQTLSVATHAVKGLTAGVKLLKPLVDAIHPSLLKVSIDFEKWMKGDSAKNYSKILADIAKTSMPNLVSAGKAVLNVLGDGFRAFAPLADDLSRSILKGATALNKWSDGGGFQRFIEYVKGNSPAVREFWSAFGDALKNVFNTVKQFSDGSLAVLTDALRGIASINPEAVKALANSFLLMRMPLAWLLINCPPLRDLIVKLLGAMNAQTIYAIAAAFVALRVAVLLLGTAFLTTPVGLIITALAALAVAVVYIATKTTWFQTAWTYTWNAIKTVGLTIWNALKVAFDAFIGAMVIAWQAVSGALVLAWTTVWNAISLAATTVWNALTIAWNAFTGALAIAWQTVSGALVLAWQTVWNAISLAATTVWNALTLAWTTFVGALSTAWTTVSAALQLAWTTVWNAISLAATTVWNALSLAWTTFVNALSIAWTTVSAALSVAWSAVWNAISLAATTVWNALTLAWSTFINGLSIVWTTVSAALSAAWSTVWNAISLAATTIWNALTLAWSTFINGLSTVWTTVSAALAAAWNTVWNALKLAAETVWNALKVAWQAFITALQTAWTTFSTALTTAWNATWNAIKLAAETVWNALKTAWTAFFTALNLAWNTFKAAFQLAWQTLWNAIKLAAETVWNALKLAWTTFFTALNTAWNTFKAALQAAWSTFWTAIKTTAQGIWDAIKAAWDKFTDGIKSIWTAASDWIKDKWQDTWNFLKDKAKSIWNSIGGVIEKAINGIINIINKLTGGFNKVAGFLHIGIKIGEIGDVNFPALANGGMVEFANGGVTGKPRDMRRGGAIGGYAPGKDTVPAVLSRGEGVLTPEAVRGLGGPGFVHSANRTWAGHRGAGKGGKRWGKRDGNGRRHGFADGGMVQHFAVGGMTAAALARAGVGLGMVSQGEHSNGSLSGGTHTGTGAVDISSTSPAVLAALKAAGFAAWIRGPADGMSPHIHAVLMNSPGLSPQAAAQVADFKAGGDGLGAGGGGGSGGGPPSWLAPLLSKAGEIISKVSQGLPLGGLLGSIFGDSGGDEKKDDDGGGLFGTGIGPDIGPDITPGKDLGDAVKKGVGAVAKFMIPGLGVDLGKFLLGLIPDGAFDFGFKWITDKLKAFVPGAGGFGDMTIDMGSKAIKGAIDLFKNENAAKAAEAQAFVQSLSGFGAMSGDVSNYTAMVQAAMKKAGIPANQLNKFLALMAAESGGNPRAMNGWDSNAMIGQASRGLMQVIPSTFAAYRDPSLPNDIFDPMANIQAAANYIKAKYGGNVPGSPYANGTPGATRGVHLVGEQGPELMNFAGGETITPAGDTASILSGAGATAMGAMGGMGDTSMPEDMMERFKLLMTLAQQMAAAIKASWTQVTGAGTTANSAMAPVFTDLATSLGTEVPGAMNAMSAANTATWTAMQTGTTAAWTVMRDGTYAEAGTYMGTSMPTWGTEMNTGVSTAWSDMAAATSESWTAMEEGTSTPVNWIIDNSYNNGIAAMWNAVAGVIWEGGGRELPTVATLATGGPVRGPGTGTSDSIPAMLSKGEHVLTAREVQKAGGHQAIYRMRDRINGFAAGGAVDGELKRGSLWPAIEGGMKSAVDSTKSQLTDLFGRGAGSTDIVSPADWIEQYVKKDDELNKFVGGPPWIPGVSDALTSWGGVTVNQRTADMLNAAMALGFSGSASQGSFSTGVAASAGTHDGGGVVDLTPASNSNVGALRAVGFAAWNRGAAWGSPSFSDHIHAVALGDPTASAGAQAQMASFLAGGNGLADGGPDNFSGGLPSIAYKDVDPADIKQNAVSYDNGGLLPTGYTLAYNGTGKPEPVGHDLVPRGSSGDVHISMPITITGNTDADKVIAGINNDVLPKLRVLLAKGTGNK